LPFAPPVDGVVVDGVVVVGVVLVVVDGVDAVDPDAALAIAAPPPAITPATPSVTRAIRNRFMVSPPLAVFRSPLQYAGGG
jgi:hypothetical protein